MMNSVARSLSKIGIFVKEAKGIEALLDSAEKDAMGFPRNADGVVDDPEFVDQVLCPVCDHEHGDQLFVKTGFVYVTCRQCSHVYVRNMPKIDILLANYSQSHTEELNNKVQKEEKRLNYWILLYEKYIQVFLASDPPNTRILDIGTGAGEFLRVCGEAGAEEVFGLDFSQTSLETSLRYGDADHFFIINSHH
jgi:hypothetical protein